MSNPPEPDVDSVEEENDSRGQMSFFDHLAELRTRILHALGGLAITICVGLYFSDIAYVYLSRPMIDALRSAKLEDKLVYTHPIGALELYMTVGIYLGFIIGLPWIMYQVWMFVAPGLYRRERKAGIAFLMSSVGLFLAGTVFGYYVMLPYTLQFLVGIQGPFKPMIDINAYFDMIVVILAGLGIVFQLPILIFFLSLFGILTPGFLWNNFRYAILIIAIVAAIVTPTTDILTMTIFMAPMILLYVLGIGVSWVVVRQKKRARGERVSSVSGVIWIVLLMLAIAAGFWAAKHYGWMKF
ncbi:MAG: twin-arginine translocase subunit TatC [Acidobacteria bacterium]|nr:twin-arginine translocase subunit TatC [Acidobacteriota bacterium]